MPPMKRFFSWATVVVLALTQWGCVSSTSRVARFDVKSFGAWGDGVHKDTAAFQNALDACTAAGGGTVVVPPGRYLIGSIVLGPHTTLQLDAHATLVGSPDIDDYPLERVRFEGEFVEGHRALVSANDADRLGIIGRGAIQGPPLALAELRNPRGPLLIEFSNCTHVVLDGFSTSYQRLWSIHLLFCDQATVWNLTVVSSDANGDGLDVDSCRHVLIEHCDMDTGDDAISLKSGRGMEAVRLARPTEDVIIRDCRLVSKQFAALGIGTELSAGIRNVRVENCVLSGRQNGIVFKSRDGRGGSIENFLGENLVISNSPTFLAINLLNKGIPATEPVAGDTTRWTLVKNACFRHIRVHHVRDLVLADKIPTERPVEGLTLEDITGDCERGLTLANINQVTLKGIDVTGWHGAFLSETNVQGLSRMDP
jgi:polygalacturonase